jgi:hypothetical protein
LLPFQELRQNRLILIDMVDLKIGFAIPVQSKLFETTQYAAIGTFDITRRIKVVDA